MITNRQISLSNWELRWALVLLRRNHERYKFLLWKWGEVINCLKKKENFWEQRDICIYSNYAVRRKWLTAIVTACLLTGTISRVVDISFSFLISSKSKFSWKRLKKDKTMSREDVITRTPQCYTGALNISFLFRFPFGGLSLVGWQMNSRIGKQIYL